MSNTVELNTLIAHANQLLDANAFTDYAPNGLQIEGKPSIAHIVTGVSANQALIDAAIDAQADALLVHHGFFWKGEPSEITGVRKRRIAALLQHDISLIGYHIPLDAHPVLGNNARLAEVLGFSVDVTFDVLSYKDIGFKGQVANALSHEDFYSHVQAKLGQQPIMVAAHDRPIQTVAWCTGAAQDGLEAAAAHGVDAFITGEIAERTQAVAQELGVSFFACGHHATERYGIQALGEHLAEQFGVSHTFIDIPNLT